MRLRRRTLTEWSLLTMLLATISGLAAWQGWLWRVDHLIYDIGLTQATRPAPDDIVIVAIDEESLARIGRWPWRRAIHATLLQRLTDAGAKAVGMDVILNEPDADNKHAEQVLADAIRRNGRVVVPVVVRAPEPGMIAEGRPTPQFAAAAAALGHIEMQLDADGIARSVYLWGGAGSPRHPQLALAMLQLAAPEVAARHAQPANPTVAPEPGAAWRRDGWLHMQFAGPPGTYRTVSYVDVLLGDIPADELRDKFVLVGATAAGLGDIHPTPMSGLGRPMPGVEVHATVLDALRSNAIIEWLPAETVIAVTLATVLTLMIGLLYLSPRDGLVLSAGVGLASLVGILLMLAWGRLWLPPSGILIGIVLAYPLWSWRRLEAAQRFIDFELRQIHDAEPGAAVGAATKRSIDPLEDRINIVRSVADRQRAIQKVRDDTMRFISHDIRSPLASIITLAEGFGRKPGDDPRLQQMGRYAQHALDLADDFFRLAKAEALDPRGFTEIDLSSPVQEAADDIWPLAEKRHVLILVRDLGSGDPVVLGDQTQLLRALINLLGNAIKFSPEGSKVEVTLREDGGWLEIAVADQGCGIAEENLTRLFTRYGRITTPGQPSPPGIGLGLLIVKTIVERHSGTVSVQSTVGAGSTFIIRLPRAASRHD
jgi:CHASE2 domain-containing sensor protein/nitrogen-specific signal transduction histidine kinase